MNEKRSVAYGTGEGKVTSVIEQGNEAWLSNAVAVLYTYLLCVYTYSFIVGLLVKRILIIFQIVYHLRPLHITPLTQMFLTSKRKCIFMQFKEENSTSHHFSFIRADAVVQDNIALINNILPDAFSGTVHS